MRRLGDLERKCFHKREHNKHAYLSQVSQIASEARDNDAYAYGGLVGVNRNYAVNGLNQYTSAGTATFAHDANGNLTTDGTNTYTYDIENRLVKAVAGSATTNLIYDPLGRLYQTDKGTAATTTRFHYDGDVLVAEYDSSNALTQRYVHGSNAAADDPLLWYETIQRGNVTRRWLHADHLGSIVAVTAAAGGGYAKNAYDEYGIPGSANVGRFQYTGQAWIPELGMYYYKARIYSPTLGRFLQTDPIGYKGGINQYAYVGNDPVGLVDPTGLNQSDCTGSRLCNGEGLASGLSGSSSISAVGRLESGRNLANIGPLSTDTTSSIDGKQMAAIPLIVAACLADPPCAAAVIAAGGIITKAILDRFFPPPLLNQEKTPNAGKPGSTHVNPGSGQVRKYGPDGKPVRDIDRDHAHGGAPNPHAHDWGRKSDGTPDRGPARPLTPEEEQELGDE